MEPEQLELLLTREVRMSTRHARKLLKVVGVAVPERLNGSDDDSDHDLEAGRKKGGAAGKPSQSRAAVLPHGIRKTGQKYMV